MIEIHPHKDTWRQQFLHLGKEIRHHLSNLALRIDHIGSTSIPGLEAKDRIDIQVTVKELLPTVIDKLNQVGYKRIDWIHQDHIPPGFENTNKEWEKWIFTPTDKSSVNVHVRILGRANQRYPLLFRDYLCNFPNVAKAYGLTKRALAKYHADNIEAYCDIKDPVCDIIIAGAEEWARQINWKPGLTDA